MPPSNDKNLELSRLDWGERLALWTFRCVPSGIHACPASLRSDPSPLFRDLLTSITSLRGVHHLMLDRQGRGLSVAAISCLETTHDERQLLKATVSAQAEAHDLVDNFLFRLAPAKPVRARLVQAIVTLAGGLGASGHWLPLLDVMGGHQHNGYRG
jgi:hypothetical protein